MSNPLLETAHIYENWLNMPRDLKKKKSGCVIRSLQSATRTQATEKEWDARFNQIGLLRATTGAWRQLEGEERDSLIAQEYLQELNNLTQLVAQFQTYDTPMGRVLSEHVARLTQGDVGEIFTLLAQRRKVLLATPHHLCNVAKVPHLPYLVSMSDGDFPPISLEPPALKRDLLVLTPLSNPVNRS